MLRQRSVLFSLLRIHQFDEGTFVSTAKAIVGSRKDRDALIVMVHAVTLMNSSLHHCTTDEPE